MDSILTSIKKMLGITEEYTQFDPDITLYINSALMTLMQIGVGTPEGFNVVDKNELWTDFLGEDLKKLGGVQSYVYLKVKLIFDPPQNSFTIDALKKQADELEWRLNHEADKPTLIEEPII